MSTKKISELTSLGILANGDVILGERVANITSTFIYDTSALQTQIDARITASGSIALTNKTIDADANFITSISNANIKDAAAIAVNKLAATTVSRALVSDGSGFVSAATTTSTEIGYVNGVTSAIQTQIDARITATGSISLTNKTIDADANFITNISNANIKAAAAIAVNKLAALTASRAAVSDASGFLASSATTATELGYVNGVTSAIQTQLNATASKVADGDKGDITVSASGVTWTIDAPVATVATGDKVLIKDISASDVMAHVTAQSIRDLAPGASTLTSAQLATSLSDETGSGAVVFGTSPTLVTPALGTPSTLVLTNATGLPPAGVTGMKPVIQRVYNITGAVATGTTLLPIDDTIPQSDEGDQYMSLAITPTNAANILVIDVMFLMSNSASGATAAGVALFQDSTANALASMCGTLTGQYYTLPYAFSHVMVAGTAAATTFKVRAGNNSAGTTTFNGQISARLLGGTMASSIIITEYKV